MPADTPAPDHTSHATTIIRDNAGNTFRVTDATSYDHAFVAVPVKRTKVGWTDKANATPRLVRRLSTTVVEGGFIIRNFAVLNYANGQTLWHYKAGIDLICQTMADGYFHNAADMIADGDVLIIKGHDGTAMRVASKPDNDTVVLSVLV